MKIFRSISILGLGWLISPAFAGAQESAPVSVLLTLDKAEAMALSTNPHIRAADSRAQAASRRVSQSLMPDDPVLMVERVGQKGGLLDTGTGTETWMLEENLGFPGKSFAKADVEGAEAKRAKAEGLETSRLILKQAREAYWDFYFQKKAYALRQESQERWKVLGGALRSSELTGQWLSLKTVRMQVETAKFANGLITLGRSLRISQFNLNHLFSLPHGTAYALAGEPSLAPLQGSEEDYTRAALKGNPEIEMAQRAVESGEARQHSAVLDHLPDVTLRLMGTRDPNGGFSDYGFRVGLSLPIFFPFKQTQAAEEAGDDLSAARYDLQGKRNEVMHMVEDAYVGAESAWRILDLYEEGSLLRQVQRAWKASEAAYRNEQIPLSEFVENYRIYLDTLTDYYQARADYGKALAELRYQTGESPISGALKGDKP